MDKTLTRPEPLAATATATATAGFVHQIRVGWGDCDPARIAYTGRVPEFALRAIEAWWDHHLGGGWYHMELDRNLGTPFVHLSLDFRAPVTPRHRLLCAVAPTRLGDSSIAFRVSGRQNDRLCFQGRFVCVFVTADRFTRQPPPADIRALVQPLLQPDAQP